MQDQSVALLTQRLDGLEHANRRLRHIVIAALVLSSAAMSGQLLPASAVEAQVPKMLIAEELLLVKDGDTRARLYVDPSDSTVKLSLWGYGQNAPGIHLTANNEQSRIRIQGNSTGSENQSVVLMAGAAYSSVLLMGDSPDLSLYGPASTTKASTTFPIVTLNYNKVAEHGSMGVYDREGNTQWIAPR